ncbi:RICIN domain-containing protein, partial [Streptomyces avermitilis]|uniref:RICIN domain-containing protein n=1 Tax=Streptomyces avermitilis TaxID=33903 RepID=UPI0031EFC910
VYGAYFFFLKSIKNVFFFLFLGRARPGARGGGGAPPPPPPTLGIAASPATATDDWLSPGDLQNEATLKCLDGSSRGIRLLKCNDSKYQRWQASPEDYSFRNVATLTCLDGSSRGLRLVKCNGSRYQAWVWRGDELHNAVLGTCLDGSSRGVRLVKCNDSKYQHWY